MIGLINAHASADVQSAEIIDGTTIWQFVVILPKAKVGHGRNIYAHVFIENDVVIGDRATIKSGIQLWDGLCIGCDVFIGPNVTFTNDKFPRFKVYPDHFPVTTVGKGASIWGREPARPNYRRVGHGWCADAVVTRNCFAPRHRDRATSTYPRLFGGGQ